jgi:hypothetical protein
MTNISRVPESDSTCRIVVAQTTHVQLLEYTLEMAVKIQ